jgi:hypothetical protein
MSTSQAGSEDDRHKSIAAPELVEEHCRRRLIEAEFALVTSRLNEIDDFKRDPQGKANPYITDLVKRRDTLLKQLGANGSTGKAGLRQSRGMQQMSEYACRRNLPSDLDQRRPCGAGS